MERRHFLGATTSYALAALALPDLDAITRRSRAAADGGVCVGRGKVLAIRQMTAVLGDAASELAAGTLAIWPSGTSPRTSPRGCTGATPRRPAARCSRPRRNSST